MSESTKVRDVVAPEGSLESTDGVTKGATPGHAAAAAALSLPMPLTPSKSALAVARLSPALEEEPSDSHAKDNITASQELDRSLHRSADEASHKGAPSISIDLSEFPPALESRKADGSEAAAARSGAPDFLTQRLRSAIGQELLADEGKTAEGGEGEQIERQVRPSLAKRQSQAGPSNASEKSWRWSTFTTLPSALKFENALQGLSLTQKQDSVVTDVESADNVGGSSTEASSSSLGPYMAALDMRKWFGTGQESAKQTTTAATDVEQVKLLSPVKGMQPGSFPTSSRKKPSERRPTSSDSTTIDSTQSAAAHTSQERTAKSNIIEHDMTEHQFGLKDGLERYPAHEYLILSTAGKPIFWSKASKARLERAKERKRRKRQRVEVEHDNAARQIVEKADDEMTKKEQQLQDDEDQTEATRVGLLQAVISNFAETDKEKLHATAKEVLELPDSGKVSFLLRPPLYLVAVSQWDDAESTLRNHLDHLYQAIISLVSATKLNRLFDRAANFDLRRLLQGTDNILDSLLTRLQSETIAMRGALQPLRLDAALRHDVGAALMPSRNKQQRPQDALYALLLTRRGIVTVARRRKNAIHPTDCHLLINTVLSTKALKEGGTQSWVPICLPKFAPQGFVYAHVSFLDVEAVGQEATKLSPADRRPDLGLVLITGNPDGFDEMSAWHERILHQMREANVLTYLLKIARDAHSQDLGHESRAFGSYSADELGLPGLRHFCFKWRANVQSTSSAFEAPYLAGTDEHKRLLCLYGAAHEFVVRSARENGAMADSAVQSDDVASEAETASLASTLADRQRRSLKPADVKRSSSPPIVARSVLSSSVTANAAVGSSSSKGLVSVIREKLPLNASPSSTHILKTANESVLAWSTANFELYLTASPHASRNALISLAKGVVKWIKQEEHRLFIVSAPIF